MRFYVKRGVSDGLMVVVRQYGHLITKPKARMSEPEAAIVILLNTIKEMELATRRAMRLADMAVDDGHRFETAVMSTAEGQELLEHLERTKPEIFDGIKNARTFWNS